AVVPLPAQAVPKRGSALRIAAGVAGAGLVSFVLYTQISPSDPPGKDPILEPTPFHSEPEATPEPTPRRRIREPEPEPSPERRERQEDAAVLPAATPTPAPPAPVEETPAPTADLSSLSARADSITRREEGGLRVTVIFTNQAALPLSAIVDGESSALNDDQGRSYSILGSSLSTWRIELAPGASARQTFDFPAPKLNSTKFLLALRAQDGGCIRVAGSPLTLEGPP
ncbi:MAG: hypothetical protein ACJ76J_17090, partial [Thermoanaerobaculia bacterium]